MQQSPVFPVSLFADWPYDDALLWMQQQKQILQSLLETRVENAAEHHQSTSTTTSIHMPIAVGWHKEDVITLGRHTPASQIYAYEQEQILLRRIDRGGGATGHNRGQLIVYPIVHLPTLRLSVPQLTEVLLETARDLLTTFGVATCTIEKQPGLFVPQELSGTTKYAKIVSIGFSVDKGVVNHGIAINIENNLSLFTHFSPCGVHAQPMTRLVDEIAPEQQTQARDLHAIAQNVALLLVRRLQAHIASSVR